MSQANDHYVIHPTYTRDSLRKMFGTVNETYTSQPVAVFQARNNVNLTDAINLAAELPEGAFLAGGFFKSLVRGTPAEDYDVFFTSSHAVLSLVNRIQQAPADSFLFGYIAQKSIRAFQNSPDRTLVFTHPSKPPINLIRIRWFDNPIDAIDKVDLRLCRVALDSQLNIHIHPETLRDIRESKVRLMNVALPISTGIRLKKLLEDNWSWASSDWSQSEGTALIKNADKQIKKAIKSGTNNLLQLHGFEIPEENR
jgi:hypothetical protein